MRPRLSQFVARFSFLVVLLAAGRLAAEHKPTTFQAGTLISIDKKVVRTPLSYVFDVVASYYETVTYQMEVRVGKQTYTVEYAPPVQPDGPLPSEWVVQAPVQVRAEKRQLIFRLASGREIETRIIGRKKNSV